MFLSFYLPDARATAPSLHVLSDKLPYQVSQELSKGWKLLFGLLHVGDNDFMEKLSHVPVGVISRDGSRYVAPVNKCVSRLNHEEDSIYRQDNNR